MMDGGGMRRKPKKDDSYCKFQNYRVTDLDDDMLCDPASSYNKEKDEDNLSGNFPVNLNKIDK